MTKCNDLASFSNNNITNDIVIADSASGGNTVAISGAGQKNATSLRVGKMVNFSIYVVNLPISGLTSTGTFYIRGLEFPFGNNGATGTIFIVGVDLVTTCRGIAIRGGGNGQNYFRVSEQLDDNTAQTIGALTCGDIASNIDIFGSITYVAQN